MTKLTYSKNTPLFDLLCIAKELSINPELTVTREEDEAFEELNNKLNNGENHDHQTDKGVC